MGIILKIPMKKLLHLILFYVVLLSACNSREDRSEFYHPAEFEPLASTCFVWSDEYYEIVPRLIGIISKKDQVTILTDRDQDLISINKTLKKHGAVPENIKFVELNKKPDNIWIRDYGPVYLVNRKGEKKLVEFNYFWSNPDFMKDFALKTGLPVIQSSINSSGGSREVNGKGTMILCEAHEMEVNPDKSKQDIENEMIQKLGQKKIIWLKQGIPQDDSFLSGPLYDEIYPKGVHGHVDEFCRFINANTLLISSVTDEEARRHPILMEARKRLYENYEILSKATDQDGIPFNVIKVPFAPLIITDRRAGPEGKIVASVTSYMNFIISSSIIVLPSYVAENSTNLTLVEKEKEVEHIFMQAFPDREIVKVRADTMNYYGGGFHCISIHEPLVK